MPASGQLLLDSKRALRQTMSERRDAIAPVDRAKRSEEACLRLLALPELQRAGAVAGFMPKRPEADPSSALDSLEKRSAVVVYPRVGEGTPRLRFHRVSGPGDLRPGAYGVREPVAACPEVALDDIDVFVVPGLAFDLEGRRLGYGGGFYDEVAAQARSRARATTFVGLAFDFQVVVVCPAGESDASVDVVVTEARVIRPSVSPAVRRA